MKDLHGRLSASTKSREEARNLLRKVGQFAQDASVGADLMNKWMSLFQATENKFSKECNQLESSFLSMKNIYEDYKKKLETEGMSRDEQPGPSDASHDGTDSRQTLDNLRVTA